MDDLVTQGLAHLREVYPSSFAVYRKRPRSFSLAYAIHVIRLARLTSAHDLLPVAFMECCALGPALVNGYLREDGAREHLAPADVGRCFQAQLRLVEARANASLLLFQPGSATANCEDGDYERSDEEEIALVRNSIAHGKHPGLCNPMVFESWQRFVRERLPELCDGCRRSFKDRELGIFADVFARLPELVGVTVDGWKK